MQYSKAEIRLMKVLIKKNNLGVRMMSILARYVGADNLNKFYLEQALLEYSIDKPLGYENKCAKLNELLNRIVQDEVRYRVYNERIMLSKETYEELFGEVA